MKNLQSRFASSVLWSAILVGALAPGPWNLAALVPEEIVIIALRGSPESREVAEHYAAARGVPREQIYSMDAKPGPSLPRETWERKVRPALRNWLAARKLAAKIRCLVTCYDVPLKLGRRDADAPPAADRREYLQYEKANRVALLIEMIEKLDRLAAEPGEEAADGAEPLPPPDAKAQALAPRLDRAMAKAQARINPSKNLPEGKAAAIELEKLYGEASGLSGFVRTLVNRPELAQANPELARRAEFLGGKVQGLQTGLAAIENLPDTVERDQQLLALLRQGSGVLGTVFWIEAELYLLEQNETESSLDSELALLYWPPYPLLRWQPNLLNYNFDNTNDQKNRPTLMVSRLEAPTVALTKAMIDASIKTEETGLEGTFYLDARGHAFQGGKGSTGDYDESIRNLAKLVKERTKIPVVLDNEEALFQPGSCPDAALYCGWYSLARYVDAFQWKPGAVAYHIASSEAETLRAPNSQVWCKRMLEQGVCATLGPTFEPYLHAFPRPEEFFFVLLSGRYTLVETYYRTLPFNSWALTLVGDPLYMPFKKNPQFEGQDLTPPLRRLLEGPAR